MPVESSLARKRSPKRKRHFNVSKSSFILSMQRDPESYDPRKRHHRRSKQADIENLGDCLRAIGEGQTLGDFSLTVVLYAEDKKTLDRALPEIVRNLHQRRRQPFLGNLQPAQRLLRDRSRQSPTESAQVVSAEFQLRDLSFLFTILPANLE